VHSLLSDPPAVSREISAGDTMYAGNEDHYFGVGRSALRCIEAGLSISGRDPCQIGRVLDLACGHGRVMRVLRAAFPAAQLVACDIDQEGVAFCASAFDATPVASATDPAKIPLDGTFDLIWCGSLLTHLDLEQFGALLQRIDESLSERGVAVVTTHGRHVGRRLRGEADYGLGGASALRLANAVEWQGFSYAPYEGSVDYGISVCSPDWLMRYVAECLPDLDVVCFMEQGWDNHQDVLVLTKRASR